MGSNSLPNGSVSAIWGNVGVDAQRADAKGARFEDVLKRVITVAINRQVYT